MKSHEAPTPVEEKFLTPGVMVMLAFMGVGLLFVAARFIFGIGAVSNLNNQFPWGVWVAIDVATGVALAAGGFTTGAIAYIFNRREYHAVIRPALLTAMLGYTFVTLGLLIDIGRYWNIWRPMISWNPTSVLFEVAVCVMIYSNVLYIEFLPIVVERFKGKVDFPGRLWDLRQSHVPLYHCRRRPFMHASIRVGIPHVDRPIQDPSALVYADPTAIVPPFRPCRRVSDSHL